MAYTYGTVRPSDDVRSWDNPRPHEGGRNVGFELDGVTFHLGTMDAPEDQDAAIVGTCNMLIGMLIGLRDPAMRRIAAAVDVSDMAPGEIVEAYGR